MKAASKRKVVFSSWRQPGMNAQNSTDEVRAMELIRDKFIDWVVEP